MDHTLSVFCVWRMLSHTHTHMKKYIYTREWKCIVKLGVSFIVADLEGPMTRETRRRPSTLFFDAASDSLAKITSLVAYF